MTAQQIGLRVVRRIKLFFGFIFFYKVDFNQVPLLVPNFSKTPCVLQVVLKNSSMAYHSKLKENSRAFFIKNSRRTGLPFNSDNNFFQRNGASTASVVTV